MGEGEFLVVGLFVERKGFRWVVCSFIFGVFFLYREFFVVACKFRFTGG